MSLAKLPYYAFIAWDAFITLSVLSTQGFFEYAAVVGWCLIAASILGFYLLTIEAPTVKCEWAGWILSPALALIVFTGVEPLTQILWVVSILALIYAAIMYRCERDPKFAERLPRYLRPFSPSVPKTPEELSDTQLEADALVAKSEAV